MAGPAFGFYEHDSLQYHFFSDNIVFSLRLFHTKTLDHASAWLYDGKKLTEVYRSNSQLKQTPGDSINFDSNGMKISTNQNTTSISIIDGIIDGTVLKLSLNIQKELKWPDTISTVIHHPNLAGSLSINGETHNGVGYCKRYSWTPAPHFWGYRFIQGSCNNGTLNIWTAEATFGTTKYDYFKFINQDGEIFEASPSMSCHRQDGAYAFIGNDQVSATLLELDEWSTSLCSTGMDSLLRQRCCKLTLKIGLKTFNGMAINETCYGTLG